MCSVGQGDFKLVVSNKYEVKSTLHFAVSYYVSATPSAMAQKLFLTGSSGLVGNRCLIKALQDGFKVIASVRSVEKSEAVRQSVAKFVSRENLDFIILDDMTRDGVFDDVIQTVDFVVHVASPLWTVTDFSDMEKAFVKVSRWIPSSRTEID